MVSHLADIRGFGISNLRLGFHSNRLALHSLKIGYRAIAKFCKLHIRVLRGRINHEQACFDLWCNRNRSVAGLNHWWWVWWWTFYFFTFFNFLSASLELNKSLQTSSEVKPRLFMMNSTMENTNLKFTKFRDSSIPDLWGMECRVIWVKS